MPDPFEVFLVLLPLKLTEQFVHLHVNIFEIFNVKIYRETIYFHISNIVCNSDLTTLTTYAHFSVKNVCYCRKRPNKLIMLDKAMYALYELYNLIDRIEKKTEPMTWSKRMIGADIIYLEQTVMINQS